MEIQTQVQKGQHLYVFGAYSIEIDSIYWGPTPSPFDRPAKPLPVNEDKGVDDE